MASGVGQHWGCHCSQDTHTSRSYPYLCIFCPCEHSASSQTAWTTALDDVLGSAGAGSPLEPERAERISGKHRAEGIKALSLQAPSWQKPCMLVTSTPRRVTVSPGGSRAPCPWLVPSPDKWDGASSCQGTPRSQQSCSPRSSPAPAWCPTSCSSSLRGVQTRNLAARPPHCWGHAEETTQVPTIPVCCRAGGKEKEILGKEK